MRAPKPPPASRTHPRSTPSTDGPAVEPPHEQDGAPRPHPGAGSLDICDHRMRGMSGTDVYQRTATVRPALAGQFILMSSDVLNPELLAFVEGRAIRLISKPFEIKTLQTIIAEMSADILR